MGSKSKYDDFNLDDYIHRYHQTLNRETFEDYWNDIQAFAENNHINTEYVEDEFILEGDFIPVNLKFDEEPPT